MILFLEIKPSQYRFSPRNMRLYNRLKSWIMFMKVTDYDLKNIVDKDINWKKYSHVIALGASPAKFLQKKKIKYFQLPQPSGLNRQNNDLDFIRGELNKCKGYLDAI